MCFFSTPKPPPIPQAVQRDEKATAAVSARDAALRATGSAATVATSTLGDPKFGKSVRVTKLGATAPGVAA